MRTNPRQSSLGLQGLRGQALGVTFSMAGDFVAASGGLKASCEPAWAVVRDVGGEESP